MTWEELEKRIDKFYLDEENKIKYHILIMILTEK